MLRSVHSLSLPSRIHSTEETILALYRGRRRAGGDASVSFAGASGALLPEAWALAAILFLWQFPHFYAIVWMYREDYATAGMPMLPVLEPDGRSTAKQMVIFTAALIA